MTHLLACLVHENQESVVDLVRNLTTLEPDATVLLYNGGADPGLLDRRFRVGGPEPIVHPSPRRVGPGSVHDFALDCMRFGLAELPFQALTIVESDQLLLRTGYAARIGAFLRDHPRAGMLGSAAGRQPPTTHVASACAAWREHELWMPYCRRFPAGETQFPHWTFWPSTVFTAPACRDLVRAFDEDELLAATMAAAQIPARHEIVLPTIVALHGHEILPNPGRGDFVADNVLPTPDQLRAGMERSDVFWAHPIPRPYDHPLRRLVRARHAEYHPHPPAAPTAIEPAPLLLTVPLLERMRTIEGWLTDPEADVLVAGVARALGELPAPHAVVEVGSYHGRSTSVLGGVLKTLRADARLYAIDPHRGEVGALDQGIIRTAPTLDAFTGNMAAAGLSEVVATLAQPSFEVRWDRPIAFLLIDALHDYANVSRDFFHFEPWLTVGAYAAFHDYADYYPGVYAFVDELLASGGYETVVRVESMILLRRREPLSRTDAAPTDSHGSPVLVS